MNLQNSTKKTDPLDQLTQEQKDSFQGGYKMVRLPAYTELWRFISKRSGHKFSPFWIDGETMRSIMFSLHSTGNFSQEFKKDNVRNNLAIMKDWSNLSWRLKIKLKQEVIAYKVDIKTQKSFLEVENHFAFGGGERVYKLVETTLGIKQQIVIPRFRHVGDDNKWAKVEHFAHI